MINSSDKIKVIETFDIRFEDGCINKAIQLLSRLESEGFDEIESESCADPFGGGYYYQYHAKKLREETDKEYNTRIKRAAQDKERRRVEYLILKQEFEPQ